MADENSLDPALWPGAYLAALPMILPPCDWPARYRVIQGQGITSLIPPHGRPVMEDEGHG